MTGIQARIVAGIAVVVVAVMLVAGGLAERGLRARETSAVAASLRARAALVTELVGAAPIQTESRPALQTLAKRAAAAAGARVTLIAPDGRVVADSSVDATRLAELENHATRPEVSAALAGSSATDRRRSATVGRMFLYLGYPALDGAGAVRLAVELDRVEAQVAGLRRQLLWAGLLGLPVALGLAWGLSLIALRPVRELRRVLARIVEGDLDERLPWRSGDELGQVAGAVNQMREQLRGRLRDVTAEKEQLQAVLAGMAEGVLVVGPDDRVALANPRLRELFGVWGEVVGRPHWEVIRRPEIEEALASASWSHEPVSLEIHLGERDGPVLAMHAVRFPAEGELRGVVAVFHDVSELRRLEGMRRDFVANVSHELRTPLTAIQGFAETLQAGELDPTQRSQYLDVILRHSERLASLIDDVLAISRAESRQLRLEPAALDLARLATTLLDDMKPRLEAAGLRGEFSCEGGAMAFADRRAVEQVLTNLLDNATKYSDPGGRIEIRIFGGAERVRVEVRDEGMGIPAEDLPRIFERFYRVDKARARDLGGTGLGLSIVKHLVQALGGEVFVESSWGQGTCFTFTLPGRDAA